MHIVSHSVVVVVPSLLLGVPGGSYRVVVVRRDSISVFLQSTESMQSMASSDCMDSMD